VLSGRRGIVWFRKIPIPPPQRVTGNSEEEGGLKRPKFLKESMSLNWNFQRGGGSNQKNPPSGRGGGMDIFWNTHITCICITFVPG